MANGLLISAIFILSLFFTASAISFFAEEKYGDTSVDKVILPRSLDSYFGSQNYQEGSYNSSISDIVGFYNNWEFQPNVGMVHTSIGALNTNYFLIDNIQLSSSASVVNTYHINNSVKEDYTIVLRYTGSDDSKEIIVKQDGLHFPEYWQAFGIILGDKDFIAIPNANQIEDVYITTYYYDQTEDRNPYCVVEFNGQTYTSKDLVDNNIVGSNFKTYYGGISSSVLGTTFVSFNSDNQIVVKTGGNILTTLDQVKSFVVFLFTMLTYQLPEHILPWPLQLLMIVPQEFMILVGFALYAKES